jgi:hypothetical protein
MAGGSRHCYNRSTHTHTAAARRRVKVDKIPQWSGGARSSGSWVRQRRGWGWAVWAH